LHNNIFNTGSHSRKGSLKANCDGIKGASGFQVSDESKRKLTDSVIKNITALSSGVFKGAMKSGDAEEVNGLLKEYQEIFVM